ncbi:MAG TPA: molybdopterin-synthase adenylyltransferase MoeB [Candidatus Polarisedimenticolaceae bacterium]|nr:molybdopterin-synthase adenylyltransferase MoeB [Candidatus Polarisedimenticolaceae bacterium]
MQLSPEELQRYGRHLTLPEVGLEGQERLRAASVVIVGAGGLGSPLGLYLAAAGVGRIGLVDFDRVDLSNLQRQVLYGTRDVGRPKLEAARERLSDVNPHVRIETHAVRLVAANVRSILEPYDVVVDGTDNFPTRYLVNDACVLLDKPNVYGSIFRFEGQASVFWAGRGPCYRCLFPEPPAPGSVPNCAEGGVLGVLPALIGAVQATEAIKLILGRGELLVGRLLLCDALEMRFRELRVARDAGCALCGDRPTRRELVDEPELCAAPPGAEADVNVLELKARLDSGEPPLLLDVRTPGEWALGHIAGAQWIPLHELPARHGELDGAREVVAYCHRGTRSALAVRWLREHGFRARNLAGGIDAWSERVDPAVPRY